MVCFLTKSNAAPCAGRVWWYFSTDLGLGFRIVAVLLESLNGMSTKGALNLKPQTLNLEPLHLSGMIRGILGV